MKKGQKIHIRQIDMEIYRGESDTIIVEGILRDERLLEAYYPTGEVLSPGTVHHLVARLELTASTLIIEDVEVEMPTIPHEACAEMLNCLVPLKGLSIVSGFAAKAKRAIGGVKGCYHLLTLLTAMVPAAIQGAWSANSEKPTNLELAISKDLAIVKNSCWVWREDGPLIKEWQSKIAPLHH